MCVPNGIEHLSREKFEAREHIISELMQAEGAKWPQRGHHLRSDGLYDPPTPTTRSLVKLQLGRRTDEDELLEFW